MCMIKNIFKQSKRVKNHKAKEKLKIGSIKIMKILQDITILNIH